MAESMAVEVLRELDHGVLPVVDMIQSFGEAVSGLREVPADKFIDAVIQCCEGSREIRLAVESNPDVTSEIRFEAGCLFWETAKIIRELNASRGDTKVDRYVRNIETRAEIFVAKDRLAG